MQWLTQLVLLLCCGLALGQELRLQIWDANLTDAQLQDKLEKQGLIVETIESDYNVTVQTCPRGSYCTTGEPTQCPPGTYGTKDGAVSVDDCTPCPSGTYQVFPLHALAFLSRPFLMVGDDRAIMDGPASPSAWHAPLARCAPLLGQQYPPFARGAPNTSQQQARASV